eukprot:gb/GECG01000735.1/.p1 GENE.gb/GECG01000735.1/~~gb/GECG01000735.1/.p1  ORF type:complete len:110 (+),score=7.10 gb/GECG01000735.1/:1-330(+)
MPGPLHQFDHVWEEIFPVGSIHFESEDVHCIPLIEKHHNQRLSPFGESRAKSPIGKQVYGLLSEFSSSSIVVRTSLPEGHETSSITVCKYKTLVGAGQAFHTHTHKCDR